MAFVPTQIARAHMPLFQALALLAAFVGAVWVIVKHFGLVGAPAVPQD